MESLYDRLFIEKFNEARLELERSLNNHVGEQVLVVENNLIPRGCGGRQHDITTHIGLGVLIDRFRKDHNGGLILPMTGYAWKAGRDSGWEYIGGSLEIPTEKFIGLGNEVEQIFEHPGHFGGGFSISRPALSIKTGEDIVNYFVYGGEVKWNGVSNSSLRDRRSVDEYSEALNLLGLPPLENSELYR